MATRAQVEKNERLFREVNERIREIGQRLQNHGGSPEPISFMCECASTDCTDRIELRLEDYARVRSDPSWFVVVPGHELTRYERVVEQQPGFTIVEKSFVSDF